MPAPHPSEFRRRAVELARLREKPVAEIARNLGISDSCLRNWMAQADVDDGTQPGLSSDERAELVALRRKNRVLELEAPLLFDEVDERRDAAVPLVRVVRAAVAEQQVGATAHADDERERHDDYARQPVPPEMFVPSLF